MKILVSQVGVLIKLIFKRVIENKIMQSSSQKRDISKVELAGCAIIDGQDRLLLFKKRRNGSCEFPGGKIEAGESPEETAKRESREELGSNVKLLKRLVTEEFNFEKRSFRCYIFLGKIEAGEVPSIQEPEVFDELFWMPIREYKAYSCAPNVVSFCGRYLKGEVDLS